VGGGKEGTGARARVVTCDRRRNLVGGWWGKNKIVGDTNGGGGGFDIGGLEKGLVWGSRGGKDSNRNVGRTWGSGGGGDLKSKELWCGVCRRA